MAFARAGYANNVNDPYKLFPCPLGTFVNLSVSDPKDLKCLECPAGKIFFICSCSNKITFKRTISVNLGVKRTHTNGVTIANKFSRFRQWTKFSLLDSWFHTSRFSPNIIKHELEALYDEKVEGIAVRARARWREHDEKNSKYFLNLEKRNNIKKHIRKLHISGTISTDPFEIMDAEKLFYSNL